MCSLLVGPGVAACAACHARVSVLWGISAAQGILQQALSTDDAGTAVDTVSVCACRIPLLPNHGNHELEPQFGSTYKAGIANNTQFQSYLARNPTGVNADRSGSSSPLWYSANVGPVHMIYLSNYEDFSVGSDQYDWLVEDLER